MKKYYIYITAIVLMLYQLNVAAQGTVDDQRRPMLLDDSLITNTDTLVSDTLDWPKNLRSKIELLLQIMK